MQIASPSVHPDEEYTLPPVEALLAGTLALMTGYAQSAHDCPHRMQMAGKLVSNLSQLASHPQLSTAMRTMLANLRTRWQLELAALGDTATVPRPHWHASPTRVQ